MADNGQKDGDQNANANSDCEKNKICLGEGLFRWMGSAADCPDNEHDEVHQRNAQDDKCEDPISNGDRSVFGVAHSIIILVIFGRAADQ